MSIGQKYVQRNVFTSNRVSNEKLFLELAVAKLQKWSFSNNLFKKLSFQQNPLKKSVEKLSFSDYAGLKSVALLRKMNPFRMNTFLPSF